VTKAEQHELRQKLNGATLRVYNPHDLALHFRDASRQHSAKVVSEYLLAAIRQEALPPTLFRTFLTAVDSTPLAAALWQQYSKYVKKVAVRQFGKEL